jgi:DNA-binding helix-hairpin-helix protein with protein kinase domain
MVLFDETGRSLRLGNQIGRAGGEGKVFALPGQPDLIAKVYHSPLVGPKVEKLVQMTRLASPNLLNSCAWPTRLILDANKKAVLGIMMPYVKGKEIHSLYNPKSRYKEYPKFTWKHLVQVSANVAAAFDSIHSKGIVMGDVNEGNVLVNSDGTVRLIDCDSYQISLNGKTYGCDVGIGLWTPPELQYKNLSNITRTTNHDLFGLAQMIFLMLFMGRHPFAGIPKTKDDFEIEEAIRRHLFAYSPSQTQVSPPEVSIQLSHIPETCVTLFRKAFEKGSERPGTRPSAKDWNRALSHLSKNLRTCRYDSGHLYPVHLSNCPWCHISQAHGINFFWTAGGFVAAGLHGTQFKAVYQAIKSINPVGRDFKHPNSYPTPNVIPRLCPVSRTNPKFIFGWIVLGLSAIVTFSGFTIAFIGIIVGIAMACSGRINSKFTQERSRRHAAKEEANRRLEAAYTDLDRKYNAYMTEFRKTQTELETVFRKLDNWHTETRAEIQDLEKQKRDIQLKLFLDKKLIKTARIQNFGQKRKAVLAAYGIESALDIRKDLRIPGIGTSLLKDLLAWRAKCESYFKYNPQAPIPEAALQSSQNRLANLKKDLESQLRAGPEQLNRLNAKMKQLVSDYEKNLSDLLNANAQADADYNVVSG